MAMDNHDMVMSNGVRLLSFQSGQFITIDSKTGSVTASSSVTDDTTHFMEQTGLPAHLQRFKSEALNQYLSIIKDSTSARIAVAPLRIESSGQSGSSSGSNQDDNASGSGIPELEMDSSSVEIFQNWKVEILYGPYSTVRIPIDENMNCYLAFEHTGEPVADPCSISPNDRRAAISLDYV